MATQSSSAGTATATPQQAYTLYAANGRIYASNGDQKLIDLGSLAHDEDGFGYLLDGNGLAADGLSSEEAALRDLSEHLRFLFLDGQFTALENLRGHDGINLDGATRLDIVLDELHPGEPIQDASV
jgi:hypothetical protein